MTELLYRAGKTFSCREFKKGKKERQRLMMKREREREMHVKGIKRIYYRATKHFTLTGSGKVSAKVSSTEEFWVMGGGKTC